MHTILQHRWFSLVACFIAGLMAPLSLSPFDIWPIAIASLSLFAFYLLKANTGKQFFFHAYTYALGYYGAGVSWVFVSIYYFGATSLILSVILTFLFITFIALILALPFYAMAWIKPQWRLLLGFPILWVLSEWVRTWFLTGFPWLYIGYSHTDTALAGWAPIGGILFISLCSCFTSAMLTSSLKKENNYQLTISAVIVISLWLGGYFLQKQQWTSASGSAVSVGLVQPNIPQDLRWSPEYQDEIKHRLTQLSQPLWEKNWIIWPEAAIPHTYQNSTAFIEKIQELTQQHNNTVISGVLFDELSHDGESMRYFNSIIGIGDSEGIYHKQRLVPFGEYVPLEAWVRGLINFFDLPFSVISSGMSNQKNLTIGQYSLANAICYEIAYPQLVAKQAIDSHVLLTVSNDAWFGRSIGPIQHLQMVRMRAMEIRRYIIRATNNGVSAIIQPNGAIQQQSQQFIATHLEGTFIPMDGETPYMYWRNKLVLTILLLLLWPAINKPWRKL